jgi:myo-inositol-1(or 4)-monophosphatase
MTPLSVCLARPRLSPAARTAIQAAEAAGRLQLELYGRTRVSWKGPGNPVTAVDRRGERAARVLLRSRCPAWAILGEEGGASGRSDHRWLIDPLDGTINYAHGVPHFASAIALEVAGVAEVGVIFDPMLGEMFVAERGRGAWLRTGQALRRREPRWRRLSVSRVEALPDALLATCSHEMPRNAGNGGHVACFAKTAHRVYTLGSAALELAWVAAGRLDAFWEAGLPPWDTAAGALLVREAGGQVSGFAGEAWGSSSRQIVASNCRLHGRVLAGLRRNRHGW